MVPIWLRKLARVRAELRGIRFPRSAGDGLRRTAALSAAALQLVGRRHGGRPRRRA